MAKFLLGTLWLAASVYLGYALTDRSFAFLEAGPDAEGGGFAEILDIDPKAISERLPAPGEDPESWYASLPEEEQSCLRRAVSDTTFQAALRGEEVQLTASETLAVSLCLK